MTASVLIVGGGPIGQGAALEAAKQGLSATIIEPRTGAIDKACGEGLMPGALRALQSWGIDPPGRPLLGVRYQSGKKWIEHHFPGEPGRGVRRLTLHSAFAEATEAKGVATVIDQVVGIESSADNVSVTLATGKTLEGDYLLACDGLHSPSARMLGLRHERPTTKTSRYGLRRHFRIEPWSDLIGVYYSSVAEVYVTPVADDEVGIAILGTKGLNFEAAIASVPEVAEHLKGATPTSNLRGAGPFPQKTTARTQGRSLLVGDASGYVDAITGEGLRVGFAQATAAVNALVLGTPQGYEASWRHATKEFRVLTNGLRMLALSPLRPLIVPAARALPAVFGGIVNTLAT
jgi:flavin-dependent dehydrogenase